MEEQQQALQASINRPNLLKLIYSLQNGDTLKFRLNRIRRSDSIQLKFDSSLDNIHTDFLHIDDDGIRRFLHTDQSGNQHYLSLDGLLQEIYPNQTTQGFSQLFTVLETNLRGLQQDAGTIIEENTSETQNPEQNKTEETGRVTHGEDAVISRETDNKTGVYDNARKNVAEPFENIRKVTASSENFISFLKLITRLDKNYPAYNTWRVWDQQPNAWRLKEYDGWGEFGRQVKPTSQGAKAIEILIPRVYSEKKIGELASEIPRILDEQLLNDPSKKQASYRLGEGQMIFESRMIFTKEKGGNIHISHDKKDTVCKSNDDLKKFLDSYVLGKLPMRYDTGCMFDIENTIQSREIWVDKKKVAPEERAVLDKETGTPNTKKHSNGKTTLIQIYNNDKRKKSLDYHIDLDLSVNDPEKMARFFNALTAICRTNGFEVLIRTADNDNRIKNGEDGYYDNNKIVINGNNPPAKICSVMLRKMANAGLCPNIKKLDASMHDIAAQAVFYSIGAKYGVDTGYNFDSITSKTANLNIEDLYGFISAVHNDIKSLYNNDIKNELSKEGINLDLSEKQKARLTSNEVNAISQENQKYVSEQNEKCVTVKGELAKLFVKYNNIPNPEAIDALKVVKTNVDMIEESIKMVISSAEALGNTSISRSEQESHIKTIKDATTRIDFYFEKSDALLEKLHEQAQEQLHKTLKAQFDEYPLRFIKSLNKNGEYPSIAELLEDKNQQDYVRNSPFVRHEIAKLLDENKVDMFVYQLCTQAASFDNISSNSGAFVEVSEYDGKRFKNGTLCHPNIVNDGIIKDESIIRNAKEQLSTIGIDDDALYIKAFFTVFVPGKAGGLKAHYVPMDVGSGEQTGLKNYIIRHLSRLKAKDEVVSHVETASKEEDYKKKRFSPVFQTAKNGMLKKRPVKKHDAPGDD